MKVDEKIEVKVPVSTAYNQWTQVQEFPRFMQGIEQVKQLDTIRLRWTAEVGGERKDWYARITRQVPDEVVSWESEGGVVNSDTVVFHPVGADKTEIQVHMEYEPEGAKEKAGGALGVPDRRVASDLKRFKDFIEERGSETGAWRGEVKHGDVENEPGRLGREGNDNPRPQQGPRAFGEDGRDTGDVSDRPPQ
jgi:uncharacterized membrane protein